MCFTPSQCAFTHAHFSRSKPWSPGVCKHTFPWEYWERSLERGTSHCVITFALNKVALSIFVPSHPVDLNRVEARVCEFCERSSRWALPVVSCQFLKYDLLKSSSGSLCLRVLADVSPLACLCWALAWEVFCTVPLFEAVVLRFSRSSCSAVFGGSTITRCSYIIVRLLWADLSTMLYALVALGVWAPLSSGPHVCAGIWVLLLCVAALCGRARVVTSGELGVSSMCLPSCGPLWGCRALFLPLRRFLLSSVCSGLSSWAFIRHWPWALDVSLIFAPITSLVDVVAYRDACAPSSSNVPCDTCTLKYFLLTLVC